MISLPVSVDSIPDVLLNFSLGVHVDTTGNLSLSTKIWKGGLKLCLRLLWIVFPSNFRQEYPESVQIIGNKPVFQFTEG